MISPAKTPAQRVLAPEDRLSAVALAEPPTGSPRKIPDATLAAPCATKSRETRLRSPSGLGTLWLIPAP